MGTEETGGYWYGAGVVLRTNDITAYLVSPSGVTAMPTQYIGPNVANASAYRLKFNKQGNHLFNVCQIGGVERYDFDRCTGILSNRNIYAVPNVSISGYWDFEISEDETKMYAVRNMLGPLQNTTKLFQYDLDTVTFLSNAQLMATYTDPDVGGALKMGPNGKIYFSIGYFGANDTCFDYLYCYSTTNLTNTNLSVINYPDSTFPACDYQAFSFYLGGHKAYFGLPNNPHYELGKWVGSPCDTLSVGIPELFQRKGELKLYYDKSWQTVFVNAEQLKGRTGKLQFYSTNGQLVDEVSIRPRWWIFHLQFFICCSTGWCVYRAFADRKGSIDREVCEVVKFHVIFQDYKIKLNIKRSNERSGC
jgi:hypothetical protein